jgi:hypothetical protein
MKKKYRNAVEWWQEEAPERKYAAFDITSAVKGWEACKKNMQGVEKGDGDCITCCTVEERCKEIIRESHDPDVEVQTAKRLIARRGAAQDILSVLKKVGDVQSG